MPDTGITLKEAGVHQIETISALAKEIWFDYYPAIISHNQIEYMLNKMYSRKALEEQMLGNKDCFLLIELENKPVGFISFNEKISGEHFINKFYVKQSLAKKGIGTFVFNKFLVSFNPNIIRLTVNRQNYKAINFYFKNGFTIEQTADFDIGGGYFMNDFIMIWRNNVK